MSFNTFGKIFRFTTWGESHGPAIGCVIDGCPPNIPLTEKDIQTDMDRRRPGQSKFTTQRKEPDKAIILSGVLKVRQQAPLFQLLFTMKIKNQEIMRPSKINLDLAMPIIPILKNMEFEISEVVVVSLQGKLQVESQQVLWLELF